MVFLVQGSMVKDKRCQVSGVRAFKYKIPGISKSFMHCKDLSSLDFLTGSPYPETRNSQPEIRYQKPGVRIVRAET
jgi:hypothetical protein